MSNEVYSPAAEAAIHFGLKGPTVYVAGVQNALAPGIQVAVGHVDRREAEAMVVIHAGDGKAFGLVIGHAPGGSMISGLEDALAAVEGDDRFDDVHDVFFRKLVSRIFEFSKE